MSKVLARVVGLAQPFADHDEMAGGGDRNELGGALHQPEDDRLEEQLRRHGGSPEHLRVERLVHAARSGRPRTRGPWRWRPRAWRACRVGVAQQLDRPPPHRLHRADRLEDAVHAVVHHLGQPAGAAGDDRGRRTPSPPARRGRTTRSATAAGTGRWPAAATPPSPAGRGTGRRRATPSSRASFSASTRSGPSPIITSVAGMARWTRAKTRTTSFTRFTSRKLETWVMSLWPSGATALPPVPARRAGTRAG